MYCAPVPLKTHESGEETVARGNLYARYIKTTRFKINCSLRTSRINPRCFNHDAIKLRVIPSIRRSTSLSILPGGFPARQLKLFEPVFTIVMVDIL